MPIKLLIDMRFMPRNHTHVAITQPGCLQNDTPFHSRTDLYLPVKAYFPLFGY